MYSANSLTVQLDVVIACEEYNCEKGAVIFNRYEITLATYYYRFISIEPRSLARRYRIRVNFQSRDTEITFTPECTLHSERVKLRSTSQRFLRAEAEIGPGESFLRWDEDVSKEKRRDARKC